MDFIPASRFNERNELLTHDPSIWRYMLRGHEELEFTSVTEFVETLFPNFDAKKVINQNMQRWQSDPNSPYYGKSEEEIARSWEELGLRAQMLGTELHSKVESYYTAVALSSWLSGSVVAHPIRYANARQEENMRHFSAFNAQMASANSWIPYKMEWKIYSRKIRLAGTLDALFYKISPRGKVTYILVDWKFCKEVKFQNRWSRGTAFCTKDLDACNYNKYMIQLCLYAYILRKEYNIFAKEIYLVNMHPSLDSFQCIRVRYEADLMNQVIAHRYRDILNTKHDYYYSK